jgi:hypothetical protein
MILPGIFTSRRAPSFHFRLSQDTNGFISPDDIHIVKNERMWMNVNLVNYGRSPALRESFTGKIFIGPDAMEQADRWFAGLGNGPLLGGPDKERVIPQESLPMLIPVLPLVDFPQLCRIMSSRRRKLIIL